MAGIESLRPLKLSLILSRRFLSSLVSIVMDKWEGGGERREREQTEMIKRGRWSKEIERETGEGKKLTQPSHGKRHLWRFRHYIDIAFWCDIIPRHIKSIGQKRLLSQEFSWRKRKILIYNKYTSKNLVN